MWSIVQVNDYRLIMNLVQKELTLPMDISTADSLAYWNNRHISEETGNTTWRRDKFSSWVQFEESINTATMKIVRAGKKYLENASGRDWLLQPLAIVSRTCEYSSKTVLWVPRVLAFFNFREFRSRKVDILGLGDSEEYSSPLRSRFATGSWWQDSDLC